MRAADIFARFAIFAHAAITASLWLPPSANAQTLLNPKIVLQTLPYGGVEVAAWTNDDRHIITANASARTLMIWNTSNGIIVDRIILPSNNPEAALSVRRLTSIEMSEDEKLVVSQSSNSNDRNRDAAWAKGAPPVALGVDVVSGEIERQFEGISPVKVQKVQQPSLFDFGGPSKVVLRELAP